MAVAMDEIVKVKRGKLLSCDEAAVLMGISGHQVRLYIRMRLMFAERVGRAYVIRSEQLALVSERFHKGFYVDAPAGRNGSINRIELE